MVSMQEEGKVHWSSLIERQDIVEASGLYKSEDVISRI